MFAVYTTGGSPNPIATAFESIGSYFDGSYFTGTSPPISYSYWPFSAVINMRNGEVIAADNDSTFLTTADIIDAVSGAGE